MRTMSGTLVAAQLSRARVPSFVCLVDDRPASMPRFSWSSVYTSVGADLAFDAAVCADGSIVRARVRDDGAGGYYVQAQRVADPSNPSQWATWTQLRTGVANSQVAVLAEAGGSTVFVVYIDANGRRVASRRSRDYGQSWEAEQEVWSVPSGTIRALGADGRGGGYWLCFGYDPGGPEPDDYLMVSQHNGTSWGAPWVDLSVRYGGLNYIGVGKTEGGVINAVVAVGPAGQLGSRQFDTVAHSFTGQYALLSPGVGSGYHFGTPKVTSPSAETPRWFVSYRLDYNAGVSQCNWLHCTPAMDWLGEGIPLEVNSEMGAKLLRLGSYWYLIGCLFIYRSPAYNGGAGDLLDVSGRVRGLSIAEASERRSRLVVALDNADGGLAGAGSAGSNEPLREGSRLALGLGYVGSAGPEHVWSQPWWIEGVAYDDRKGEGLLVVECVDCWGLLEGVWASRQVVFSNATLHEVLRRALWPVVDVGAGAVHANLNTTAPLFVWQPGESYAAVARRVLRMAGLGLRFKTVGAGYGWDSVGVGVWEYGVGVSAYSYGPSGHWVSGGRFGTGSQRANVWFVQGLANQAWVFDREGINLAGGVRLARVFEKHLDSFGRCQARGDYEMRRARVSGKVGLLEAWANVGLEVGDVVDVSVARAGLDVALRRVAGIETVYDQRRGRFEQAIELEGV